MNDFETWTEVNKFKENEPKTGNEIVPMSVCPTFTLLCRRVSNVLL